MKILEHIHISSITFIYSKSFLKKSIDSMPIMSKSYLFSHRSYIIMDNPSTLIC